MKKSIAIIGAGIAGLSAGFYALQRFGENLDMAIFEKEDRLGGTINTTRESGYIVDWGSNGFLDKEPLTLELIRDIGLADKLSPSNQKSAKRFIFRNNRLWEINPSPKKFLSSKLLSLKGRMRIVAELLVPGKKSDEDESIFDFASRRIGREAAEIMIDPMVSGIFGGDARRLSLKACFPAMFEMEREYGGLIKAMIARKKAAQKEGKKSGGPAGPGGHLTSFENGLYTLIERLGEVLNGYLRYPIVVRAVSKGLNGKFTVATKDASREFDHVIIAAPSYIASELLKGVNQQASELLGQIPYANLAVVCQGYEIDNVGRDVDGFGFLVPHNQGRDILGSIWTSAIYPEQAPDGHVLFRTMLGGAKNNEIINKSEQELGEITHHELSSILDLKGTPSYQKVIIWDKAIPQYTLGHLDRLQKIEHCLGEIGSIHLAGNAYTGIGMNDTIKRSHQIINSL